MKKKEMKWKQYFWWDQCRGQSVVSLESYLRIFCNLQNSNMWRERERREERNFRIISASYIGRDAWNDTIRKRHVWPVIGVHVCLSCPSNIVFPRRGAHRYRESAYNRKTIITRRLLVENASIMPDGYDRCSENGENSASCSW